MGCVDHIPESKLSVALDCDNPPTPLSGSRRGSPLFHFLGHLGSLGSCCARNGFWCCHNIRPKLRRSLICDNRSSQCPYCVLFSRLGSLTTVLTWLRSRACAGMQGWALCACVQTGFTHHGSHLVAVACMCRDAGGSVSVGVPTQPFPAKPTLP